MRKALLYIPQELLIYPPVINRRTRMWAGGAVCGLAGDENAERVARCGVVGELCYLAFMGDE